MADFLRTCERFSLTDSVINAIFTGAYTDTGKWKREVTRLVTEKDFKSWQIWSNTYKSLQLYSADELGQYRMSPWWIYNGRNPEDGKYCRLLARLMLNSYRLGRTRCELCNDHNMNSIHHILFECVNLIDVRNKYWELILHGGLPNLYHEMCMMDPITRRKFIFSGFRSDFIYEWNGFYRSVLLFVYKVYMAYYMSII